MLHTLESVVNQSLLPTLWIIVDDGSTDDTPKILADYSSRFPWIQIVRRQDRGHRSVGPGVIEAFYDGFHAIQPERFEYLCKLDLDLRLPSKYFETLIDKMEHDPSIATCSGKAYVATYKHGQQTLVSENHGNDTSIGATKFYRTEMFLEIGGFVREVMWDGIDCHMCRMHGWKACSWDEPDLRFTHLRPMGSSQHGILVGRARHGFGQYFMGTHFLYLLASAVSRSFEKPYIIGSAYMVWGFISSALKGMRRLDDPSFRKFLRSYQWRVLFSGKSNALNRIHNIPVKCNPAAIARVRIVSNHDADNIRLNR
jgi:glycosyltransferase involved in cell wall biosynthesis